MSIFRGLFGKGEENILPDNEFSPQSNSSKITAVSQNLPIDIIYDFLKQDFEEKGFMDAQKNPDITNRNHNKELIKSDFGIKVREVLTEYNRLKQLVEIQITVNTSACSTFQLAISNQKKQLYTDHIAEIGILNEDFKAGKLEVIKVLTSYDCGFDRGVIYVSNNINI